MNLLRWNNAQRPQGKSVEPSASHSGQGLEVKKRFSLPVEGEVFSLTFPFIDQAFTLRTLIVSAIGDISTVEDQRIEQPAPSASVGFMISTVSSVQSFDEHSSFAGCLKPRCGDNSRR